LVVSFFAVVVRDRRSVGGRRVGGVGCGSTTVPPATVCRKLGGPFGRWAEWRRGHGEGHSHGSGQLPIALIGMFLCIAQSRRPSTRHPIVEARRLPRDQRPGDV